MLKSSKRITITTEAVNSHGFKVSTSGIDLSHFKKNPLMLWMHCRATGSNINQVLPLGYWDDVKVKGTDITGIPLFDDKDEFALSIYHKVENGTIRMASAGLVPVSWNEIKGTPVLEQSILKEASLVDFGSNAEALAVALYDEQDNQIKLTETIIKALRPSVPGNSVIQLNASDLLPVLGLRASATSQEVMAAIDQLSKTNEALTMEHSGLVRESARLMCQITELQRQSLQLKAEELAGTGWDELFKSGRLEGLKLNYPELYRLKFKEQFGREPRNR